MFQHNTLPDIATTQLTNNAFALQWVGMEQIAVPLILPLQYGQAQNLAAKASIYVSLDDPAAKGIHMSRLHAIVNQLAIRECNKATLDNLLNEAVRSQAGTSNNAKLQLTFGLLLKKPSLLSDETGYQTYDITITGESRANKHSYAMEITLPYSSTCPCSASLARQLYANEIDIKFPTLAIDKKELLQWLQSDAGSVATPHSQRSYAYINMVIGDHDWPDLAALIFEFEKAIGTPVQTAVKRSDEQEFARLNATNLMFCEDAARRLKGCLEKMSFVDDYQLKVEHQESLHAHNAVVIDKRSAR